MKKNLFLIVLLLGLIAVAAYFYNNKSQGIISQKVISDFAIEDTASIHRIVITDFKGKKVDLKRNIGSPLWSLNDSLLAKEYSVEVLLKTFKSIYVIGPIGKAAKEHVIRNIAGTNTAVQIYDENGDIIKTYFIGSCAPGQKGTYMVLENGDGERSSEPVITTKKGYIGCLRQRFFTNVDDWIYTGIFDHPQMGFKKVSVRNNFQPEESFSILYGGGNNITLIDELNRTEAKDYDLQKVKDYLLLYKKVHFETLDSHMPKTFEDSLKNALPLYSLTVTDLKDESKTVEIHPKAAPESRPEWDTDLERMYAVFDKKEVGLVQIYHFGPLYVNLSDFAKEK